MSSQKSHTSAAAVTVAHPGDHLRLHRTRKQARFSRATVRAALIALLCAVQGTAAAAVTGRVVSVDDGQGIAQASVTVSLKPGSRGPAAITVFTDRTGVFRLPGDLPQLPADSLLGVRKLGYEQVRTDHGAHSPQPENANANPGSDDLVMQLYMSPVADIASHAPASAWLARAPAGDAKNITVTSCSSCHQLPSPRMKQYAAQIEAVRGGPEGDRKAVEEWRKVVRHESWRTIVKYMRSMHYAVFPLESAMNLDAIDWPTAQNADYNFFSERQGEIVANYLADNFPRIVTSLPRAGYEYGAPLGVNENTVIREFAFPDAALVRELVAAPGSPYLWGADVRRNLIVRLDPADGATKWYPVDFHGSTGPTHDRAG